VKVLIASDHAGLSLKTDLVELFREKKISFEDLGPQSPESVDYPDFAVKLARRVSAKEADLGVLVCGTGIGMSIAANKVQGVRAAVCTTEFEARMARAHNDANVLCVGQRVVGPGVARALVEVFLSQPFEAGRHANRVKKITDVEA
jgi:ribose 5-phosphate isomerase B